MNTYDKKHNWGLNSEMENLLNGIELNTDKQVLYTDGDKQYMYDNGQVYTTNSKYYSKGKLISKAQFKEQTEEMIINYKCNRNNDIVIE